jgi:hypothetical protein
MSHNCRFIKTNWRCAQLIGTPRYILDQAWSSPACPLRGGFARSVDWKSKIVITSPIFHFRAWFLAQIVENRETRLSRLVLGPGDNFLRKLWRKQICHTNLLVICDLRVTHHPQSTISKIMRATSGFVFVITFSGSKLKIWQSYDNFRFQSTLLAVPRRSTRYGFAIRILNPNFAPKLC